MATNITTVFAKISSSETPILEEVLGEIPVGMAWCDSDGRLVAMNYWLERELGLTQQEWENWYAWELFLEKDSLAMTVQQIINGQPTRLSTSAHLLNPRQASLWCEVTLCPSSLKSAAMLVIQPQTHPTFTVQNRAAQSDIMQVLDKHVDEGIFRISERAGLEYANQKFVALFGYPTLEEVEGRDLQEFFASETAYNHLLEELELVSKLSHFQARFLKKNGGVFSGRINLLKTIDDDGFAFFTGSLLDISQFEASQVQLEEKTTQLQELNRQLDQFLYSACHDLRSPISSMQGLIHLMQLDFGKDQWGYIDRLNESLSLLDGVTHDMITIAKNSHRRVKSERIQFESMLNELLLSFKGVSEFNRIDFQLHISASLPFFTDKERLQSILLHLCKNAIMFFDRKSEHPFVKIEVDVRPEKVMIDIIDNGDGIPKAHLAKVYDMFYRASDRSSGPGLGLYIVQETLRKLGGTISLESEVGFGTIVNLEIANGTKGRLISKKLKLYGNRPLEIAS